MKITGAWLCAPSTQRIFALLGAAGFACYGVGGCVRNAILGAPVADVDLCTDAPPERVMALAKAAGLRALPTGIDHGTVTLIAGKIPYEITTFRQDVETNGRHARVVYSRDILQDAQRRDLTINALYVAADGQVIDPLGQGLSDIASRRLRFVGDAEARIREDYLRILRYFRFYAFYGDPKRGFDPETLAACAAHVEGLAHLSKERVGAEMRKLLAAPDPSPAVAGMAQTGALSQILPGAMARALAPLVWHEKGAAPRWLRRLAALGMGGDFAADLRLSRAEASDLTRLQEAVGAPWGPAALGYKLGPVLGMDAVMLRAAYLDGLPPAGWQEAVAFGASAKLPVSAQDFMPALSGPALGQKLRQLEERWLSSELSLTRAALLG